MYLKSLPGYNSQVVFFDFHFLALAYQMISPSFASFQILFVAYSSFIAVTLSFTLLLRASLTGLRLLVYFAPHEVAGLLWSKILFSRSLVIPV